MLKKFNFFMWHIFAKFHWKIKRYYTWADLKVWTKSCDRKYWNHTAISKIVWYSTNDIWWPNPSIGIARRKSWAYANVTKITIPFVLNLKQFGLVFPNHFNNSVQFSLVFSKTEPCPPQPRQWKVLTSVITSRRV